MNDDQPAVLTDDESMAVAAAAADEQASDPAAEAAAGSEVSNVAGERPPEPLTSGLSTAIAVLERRAGKTHDRLLRTAADLENYKRRARRELQDETRRAEEQVVLAFLPVLDNLERAIEHVQGAEGASSVLSGLEMVHKQFLGTLSRYEIEPVITEGKPFDPQLHEAVQQQPSELPRNIVVRELQRGYVRGGRLVRPAMVLVSSGPPAEAPVAEPSED